MDRQQHVENRLGAALYRVACLKQQMSGARSSPRLLSRLVLELDRLTGDLEHASHDLAEAREAALAARELADAAETRARLFFEMCPLACLTLAQDGTILEANPAASALLNVSARHLCGKPLHLFVNGQRAEFMSQLMTVITGTPTRWSGRLQPRERSVVQVEVVGTAQPNGQRILLFSRSAGALSRARDAASHPLDRGIENDALELRHS
jgi:PAS domain S-box-containing protein